MWYVIGSRNRQNEIKIRDAFRKEGRECFVPLRYEIWETKGRKERRLVPAVSGIVFLKGYGTVEDMREDFLFRKDRVFLRKSTYSNKADYLTVSDHEMENFIAVVEKAGEKITYFNPSEIQLRPGEKIRVNGGPYDGREGIIMRVKGKRKKQLVVSIPGILIASVEMEPDLVEVVADPSEAAERKGRKPVRLTRDDIDADKKSLMKLSKRLLFETPLSFQQEKEYYLLVSELKRTVARLYPVKGVITSQEVELALPLYLSAVILQQNVDLSEARLRKALAKLQDSSLLKLRAQMYLAVLSHDEALRQEVEERLSSWKGQKLSLRQRVLLEEYEGMKSA